MLHPASPLRRRDLVMCGEGAGEVPGRVPRCRHLGRGCARRRRRRRARRTAGGDAELELVLSMTGSGRGSSDAEAVSGRPSSC